MRRLFNAVAIVLVALIFSCQPISAASNKTRIATGTVVSIDLASRTIHFSGVGHSGPTPGIKTTNMVNTFSVDFMLPIEKNTVILIAGKRASLKDIQQGDTVTIRYYNDDSLGPRITEISKAK